MKQPSCVEMWFGVTVLIVGGVIVLLNFTPIQSVGLFAVVLGIMLLSW